MPGMNGKELAKSVEQLSDSIKILFTSGYEEAYISGNRDYFQ